jgi:serine/threonine-protein kinase
MIVNRRYKIERKIGDGGMAEVFLGHDDLLHRPVAIKSLRSQYAADAGFRARFEREAQAAASFSHPNIIDIYDVGEDRGTPFLVMEYVPGETLKQIIDNEGPFHPDDVAILIEQVAAALDYAHERGFVHRDIKPQNILVDSEGLAKVVDFGIAKGLSDTTLTEAGSSLGTVHYVSPEQASGLMATPSSDIYSLAVVAYEMLTKRLPFESDTPIGTAMKHINEQPPHLSLINPDVPRQVGDIILRALSKDPTRRFTSAGSFARALNSWRTYRAPDVQTPRPTEPPPPRPPVPADLQPTIASMPVVNELEPVPRPVRRSTPAGMPAPLTASTGGAATMTADPFSMASERRSSLGCVSWLVGAGVIAVLVGLIWFGGRLSDRLSGLGDDPNPTPTSAVVADSPDVTATATVRLAPTITAQIISLDPTETPAETVETVIVPDLRGSAVDDAIARLDSLGLVLEYGDQEASEDVPEGNISRQEPEANTEVSAGTAVRINRSTGPATIDLAKLDLVGIDYAAARQTLENRGLVVDRYDERSADYDTGTVVRLEPGDSARPGDTVTLVISAGNMVQIPGDLQGMPRDQARTALENLGLTIANEFGVSEQTIHDAGIDNLTDAGIEDGDVVGIQDSNATFGGFVEPESSVTLIYYDESKNAG